MCFCLSVILFTFPCFLGTNGLISVCPLRALASVHCHLQGFRPAATQTGSRRTDSSRRSAVSSGQPANWHVMWLITIRICCWCCFFVCVHLYACSWHNSGCRGDGVGGFSQWNVGEGGAGHTKDGVCFTGTRILRREFDSANLILDFFFVDLHSDA